MKVECALERVRTRLRTKQSSGSDSTAAAATTEKYLSTTIGELRAGMFGYCNK